MPFALRFALVSALSLVANGQQLLWTFTGSVGDEYGAAVLHTGDQNNDGYGDVLVGAPGWNGGRGYVRCLSGKFLATGSGTVVLWTLYPSVSAGARFGSSLAEVATLTGNSATDFVVGAPGYTIGSIVTGAVFLIDGSTHTAATHIYGEAGTHLGQVVVAIGDQDGDGKIDIAANAPAISSSAGSKVHTIPGSSFGVSTNLANVPHASHTWQTGTENSYGFALASGFDLDGDGRFDLAVGSPELAGSGAMEVFKANAAFTPIAGYLSSYDENLGSSIDGTRDFDGDGVVDFVIGAPAFVGGLGFQSGRAVVVSGERIRTNSPPFELHEMRGGVQSSSHFGACVRASADLNNDGTADFIVGMPDYSSFPFPSGAGRGGAVIYSGRTGLNLASFTGLTQDRLGNALLGGFRDLNADGFLDFAVAGSLSDNSGNVDCGALKFYSLFPTSWSTYCTSKVNSLGCTPSISASGSASANPSTAFSISCANVINQTSGLLFYSRSPYAAPFQGGTFCVEPPLKRTPVLSSGGSASGTDCSGSFSYDFGARIHSGVDASLVAGAEVFVQCWSRDSASPSTTSLSNALRFVINP